MLKVSDNQRFLKHSDGSPFFFLGDTAWDLFARLTREEADYYLKRRSQQGFTVIQAVALYFPEHRNAYGEYPLINDDPAKPNEAYFKHVDYIVAKAQEYGLYIGMLPTWGANVVKAEWHKHAKELFNDANALSYGKFMGRRYRDNAIIWIIGGDRVPTKESHFSAYRSMVKGIREEDNGVNLTTYHPCSPYTSAAYFHNDDWLDFNMLQSGHAPNTANYERIAKDYALEPAKPCMDGEPGYENLPSGRNADGDATGLKAKNGYMTDYDARKFAYWSVFAGAHGHTYGCNEVLQFFDPEKHKPQFDARIDWRNALELPGATQMTYFRRLMESRPDDTRIPDQTLLASSTDEASEHRQATRSSDGSYAMVYAPTGSSFDLKLSSLSGEKLKVWWFNPRTGTAQDAGILAKTDCASFTPPTEGEGHDWVLILDDASRNFDSPGK